MSTKCQQNYKKKKEEETKYPSAAEPNNKFWYVHTKEYYSVSKRNSIFIYTIIWMNLKNQLNLTPRRKYLSPSFVLHLYEMANVI